MRRCFALIRSSFKTRCNYRNNYFNICYADVEVVAFSKSTALNHASGISKTILINWCLDGGNRKIR